MIGTTHFPGFRLRSKILSRHIKISLMTMSRHGNVSQMPVHHAGGKNEGLVDGCTLAFVDRRRVAMVDIAVAVLAEHNVPATVETNGQERAAVSTGCRKHGSEHA